ncbi:flippase [Cupriavidus sp. CuC1]|uniref:flippase n=1 Tax=Cupriavidus sp. CuC1 TaxID=3373131 RepID=UPI0037CE6245
MSLRRNTLWNLAGTGLPFLLGALTIPYLLKKIGVEAFGVLTLVWALVGYFSLFDFGLGRALTQQVASARSTGLLSDLPSLVKTGLWFTAGTGVIGGLALAALSNLLAQRWLNVSVALQPSTVQALLIAALGIPLTTVTTGLRGILEAYEDFRIVNLLRIVLGTANFGLPALSAMFIGDSLAWMVAGLIAVRVLVLFGHAWSVHRKLPAGWISAGFSPQKMRGLLSFGAWMTVSNIIGPLMVTADRFVISAVLGASFVAYYTVPSEMLTRVLILPGAVTAALFPRLASILTSDPDGANALYRRCIALVSSVMAPLCLLIAACSYWGLTLWLGRDFADHSWSIVVVMAVGILLNGVAFVPFAAIQAAGHAHMTAKIHAVELMIYLPLLVFSLHQIGLLGAAMVWTARVGADLIALLIFARRYGFDAAYTVPNAGTSRAR